MTRYEEMIAAGTLPPMNSIEWCLLDMIIEQALKDPEQLDKGEWETLILLETETEHALITDGKTQEEVEEFFKLAKEKTK